MKLYELSLSLLTGVFTYNFNAGYCRGQLSGFGAREAAIIGAITASLFVAEGRSLDLKDRSLAREQGRTPGEFNKAAKVTRDE